MVQKHFLETLKKANVIDESIISFSIASKNMKEMSYAILGGYNQTQVSGDLVTFDNYQNELQTWALEAQGIKIGNQEFKADNNTPAIIDTGTSLFALPPKLFAQVIEVWKKELG